MKIHQDEEDMWRVISEERAIESIGDVRVMGVIEKEEVEVEVEREKRKTRLISMTQVFSKTRFCSLLQFSLPSISSESSEGFSFVNMLYKRKKDKVRPVDQPHSGGTIPKEQETWKEPLENGSIINPFYYGGALVPKCSQIKQGLHLMGIVRPKVEPSHKIPTVEYKAWQASSFRVPKGLREAVREIIEEQLRVGMVERCWGPYRNLWFLMEKKNKKHRLILAAQRINAVIIKDVSPTTIS